MKKDKKVLIIITSSILILLSLLVIFLVSASKNKGNEEVVTTTTTTKIKEIFKEITDEKTQISVKLFDENYFNYQLLIENIENVVIEDSILVYDINLVDNNNSKIQVENSDLIISIPYTNDNNYSQFKVLNIDENNEVLETINASYENGKIIFNVNHLSRYAILGIKNENTTTTTKKNNNSKTTTKVANKNNTTTNSMDNNDSKKEWTVTFYVDGKVSSVVKVKDGNTVSKPKNPSDIKNQTFSHWVNSRTGKKFDFNTKIYKNYEVFAEYKTKDDNQNIEASTTTPTTTTTKKQYDTTITLYTGNAETPKKYTIKSGGSKVLKYYYSYFKGQADSDAPVKINVTGNPDYTYVVSPKNSSQESGVPALIFYRNNGGSHPYYIESEKVDYLNIFYYDENNKKEHAATVMIYFVDIYLGDVPSYPIYDGWTDELAINEKNSLNIYGDHLDGVLCQSDNPNKLIVTNDNSKVEYYATESGYYTLTCYAKNFPSAKTVINVSIK